MVETLQNLALGFSVALPPTALIYAFLGCHGRHPGRRAAGRRTAGRHQPAAAGDLRSGCHRAIVLLAGIYYGAMYGGSTTSILMRIPGEAASVMTCIDGYAMRRRAGPGRPWRGRDRLVRGRHRERGGPDVSGPAAGRVRPPVRAARVFALLVLGLLVLAYMSGGSMLRAIAMAATGLCWARSASTHVRLFPLPLRVGRAGRRIGVVPIAVGLFGISEILLSAGRAIRETRRPRMRDLLPSPGVAGLGRPHRPGNRARLPDRDPPGSAHIISTFVSYAVEKRLSNIPSSSATAPSTAWPGRNRRTTPRLGRVVPMLALGLPSGPIPAIMLAA